MASNKYYVVFNGRKTGIFTTWEECENQTKGFSDARYKSFKTREEAEAAFNRLPNAENAVVDICKLSDYCLNPEHNEGKNKTCLFSSILGMTADYAEELRQILLETVKTHEVKLGRRDEFGQRYILDFTLEWQNRSAIIRSAWIIENDSDIPRLTTCYPL
ncbi:MAG: viroplasmin family protein [Gloeotrichia echinulata GP01]